MNYRILILSLLAAMPAFAQTDLVFPWVTNQSQFRGTIIVNNLSDETATISLTATRAEGESPETETVTGIEIGPLGQMVTTMADLFQELGEGKGAMVQLQSESANITAAFVNLEVQRQSNSPSQANAFRADQASNILLYNYMYIDDSAGFTSPVVVNMGEDRANLTFYAWQNGVQVATATRELAALHPLAELTGDLFADVSGDLYVIVESDQPVLGTAFTFNTNIEPSMANAVSLDEVPMMEQVDPVSFSIDILPIIRQSCALGGCHVGSSPAGGLSLNDNDARRNIVGRQNAARTALLVDPGSPSTSYFYLKLMERNPPTVSYSGSQMPFGGPPLSPVDIEKIGNWITQGANQ